MRNNFDEVSKSVSEYLAHYRTVGSKNGVSTTPGYKAIGQKAVGVLNAAGRYVYDSAISGINKVIGSESVKKAASDQAAESKRKLNEASVAYKNTKEYVSSGQQIRDAIDQNAEAARKKSNSYTTKADYEAKKEAEDAAQYEANKSTLVGRIKNAISDMKKSATSASDSFGNKYFKDATKIAEEENEDYQKYLAKEATDRYSKAKGIIKKEDAKKERDAKKAVGGDYESATAKEKRDAKKAVGGENTQDRIRNKMNELLDEERQAYVDKIENENHTLSNKSLRNEQTDIKRKNNTNTKTEEPKKETETKTEEPKKETETETKTEEPKKETKAETKTEEPKKETKAETKTEEPKKETKTYDLSNDAATTLESNAQWLKNTWDIPESDLRELKNDIEQQLATIPPEEQGNFVESYYEDWIHKNGSKYKKLTHSDINETIDSYVSYLFG